MHAMTVQQLQHIGQRLTKLAHDYAGGPKREMLIDPALYAWFLATTPSVARQYHVHLPGLVNPARIDFRIGGPNPVLVEFAVRPPGGASQLYGSQNKDELRKLTRFSNQKAKLRALLLIDLHQDPIVKESLKATYDKVHAGFGNFDRHPVKVIYTHREDAYSFKWSPFKSA
jgi:hypothetical protein